MAETQKRFPGTRDQYTELAAYWLEDVWQDNPNSPSPMKGFKERFGTFESTIAGETRQMQPKTSSKYNKAKQGPPGESPKGVTLVSSDTVDSYSETRRFNEAIPIEIEIQIKALELNGKLPDGSPLPQGFGWKDFQKKVSSGIGDLKKIQKLLKATGEKVDLGHYLPIGREIDNAARHQGKGPPNVGTSQRIEDQTLNRGGGARAHKDPKRSILATLGIPRSWTEVVANYAIPEGTPQANNMFGSPSQLERFVNFKGTNKQINDYLMQLESSNVKGLQQFDTVSGLPTGEGRDPATLQKAPELPSSKLLKTQRIARNTIRASHLQGKLNKREALFDVLDAAVQGDIPRAVGSAIRLTPKGATANIVGEGLNALTQATTGQSLGDRAKLALDPKSTQLNIEAQITKAKNLRNNRRRRNALRTVWNMPVPELSPNQRFSSYKEFDSSSMQRPTATTKRKTKLTKMRRR